VNSYKIKTMEAEKAETPPSQEVPQVEEQSTTVSESRSEAPKIKKKPQKILVYVALALIFMVIGAFGFWFYQQVMQKNGQSFDKRNGFSPSPETETQPTSQPTSGIPSVTGLTVNKVFYAKDNNIFTYDAESKQASKLTNYPKNESYSPAYDESGKQKPSISIKNIRVIDENNIGFGKCGIITGDFGCGMHVLNLETSQVIEKKKLDSNMLLLASDWHTPDIFSYLVTADEKWQVYLNTKSGLRILEDITIETYGRGGFVEDSEKIRFSPDGKYVLQISTSSPRSPSDFNVYVYNVGSDVKNVLSNATQPEWVDNNKIVYRKYEKEGDGLYVYDVINQTQNKLQEIANNSYRPEVLLGGKKILYENNADKQVWLYDLSTHKNTIVVENALSPFWLTSTKIVYNEIELCNGREGCGGMVDYEVKNVAVYDLATGSKIENISGLQSNYGMATQFH